MKKILYILFLVPVLLFSQEKLKGTIYEQNPNNDKIKLSGANVYWLNTSIGVVTNMKGEFTIPYSKEYKKLVISFVGYKSDTLTINSSNNITHWLQPTSMLDEVLIETRKKHRQFLICNRLTL